MAEAALHYWDAYWDLREKECPCDVHFIEWLDQNRITDATIYHFGTGGHHHVGIECARPERPQRGARHHGRAAGIREIRRARHRAARMCCATTTPSSATSISSTRASCRVFDVVTLFHLCEFRGDKNDAYNALTDLEVANLLTDKTRPGGHILFFTTSFAFDWDGPMSAKRVIAQWEKERDVERVGAFKSLLVYRKRG